MRKGAIFSGFLHAAVIALLIFGLPRFFEDPEVVQLIPVELVTPEESEKAGSKAEQPDAEKVAEKAPVPEPPKPVEHPPPPPAPPAPEPPRQQAELAPPPPPEPTPPESEPEPVPEPPPSPPQAKPAPPKPPEQANKPLPPRPRAKPAIKLAQQDEPQAQSEPDRLSSILRNVEKLKAELPEPLTQQAEAPRAAQSNGAAGGSSDLGQMELARSIKQQMERCWRIDPGVRSAEDLVVEIYVVLNPDGTVRRADILDGERMNRDAYFRSAAENARRAIYNCSPFTLPLKKFRDWQELTLTFNPEEMFGT